MNKDFIEGFEKVAVSKWMLSAGVLAGLGGGLALAQKYKANKTKNVLVKKPKFVDHRDKILAYARNKSKTDPRYKDVQYIDDRNIAKAMEVHGVVDGRLQNSYYNKTAGVGSWLGRISGISDFSAGRKAMKEALPKAKEGLDEMKYIADNILKRKQELRNRLSVMSGKKPRYKNLPEGIRGSSVAKLQSDIKALRSWTPKTIEYHQPAIDALSKAKATKDKGIKRMSIIGGAGAGLGLGAAYLKLKKKKNNQEHTFAKAVS